MTTDQRKQEIQARLEELYLKGVIIPPPEAFMSVIRDVYNRGEIKLEDYASCLRRYREVKDEQI